MKKERGGEIRMVYYTYFLRCADGSLYAGIAANLPQRMEEHFSGTVKAAKYTRSHPPKELCAAWESDGRAAASRLEYRLKRLSKDSKERLVRGDSLSSVFDPAFAACYRAVEEDFLRSCVRGSE